MRRCGSGTAVRLAQNLRGAEGRCDSVRVFCEAGVDRAFTASQRISSGWWGRVGVEGKDGGCDGKGALPGREDCGCENDVRAVSLAPQAARKKSHDDALLRDGTSIDVPYALSMCLMAKCAPQSS